MSSESTPNPSTGTQLSERSWWQISSLFSLLFILILVFQWINMNEYTVQRHQQLINSQAANSFLEKEWRGSDDLMVTTGIFVQSLKFVSSVEVHVSGYLWQHYRPDQEDIKPKEGEVGFVFPESVDTQVISESYRKKTNDGEVIGWYFETTIRQPFDYSLYPFDHKTMWLRMWHKDFASDVVLVPDFEAYDKTGVDDIFGIEKSIVLGRWERRDTYFNYRLTSYDNNFGLSYAAGQRDFPELHYNFVVKRKFENAFVVHLLPLFLVAGLLFGMLLTINDDKELANRHGFSTSAMIGACSALFFVILLSHIQLREQFASTDVVYLEYFYIVIYGVLGLASAYTYLFSQRSSFIAPLNCLPNGLVIKLAYWPLLLGSFVVLTALVLAMKDHTVISR